MRNFTVSQIKASTRAFNDLASDLEHSDNNNFDGRIEAFFDFCKKDPFFSNIDAQLMHVPGADVDEWAKPLSKKSGLKFPTDRDIRTSIQYQFLSRFADGQLKVDHLPYIFALASSRIDPYIEALNTNVTRPLIRDLRYRIDALMESFPGGASSQIPASSIQIINAQTVIQQHAVGSHITQSAQIANAQVTKLFEQLRLAVKEANLSAQEEVDAIELVTQAESEAGKEKPKVPILKALLTALPHAESITSIVTAIVGLFK